MSKFNIGDRVEVLDPSLAMLRNLCPDMPPNHYGVICEVWENKEYLISFPIGGDDPEEHSQVAPYPEHMIRPRR